MDGTNAILCAAVSWLVAQILKAVLYYITNKHFKAGRLTGSGGMPSTHSAAVTGFTTAIFIRYGLDSFEFSISGFLAIIVMYDACHVRWAASLHAKRLNAIAAKRAQESGKEPTEKPLDEFIGHTLLQVLVGGAIGIVVGLLMGI